MKYTAARRDVLAFLKKWLDYSDLCVNVHKEGKALPINYNFRPWCGLCACADKDPATDNYRFKAALKSLFMEDGLDSTYPFGQRSFGIRWDNNTQVLQRKRRRWVKATILKLEKELGNG